MSAKNHNSTKGAEKRTKWTVERGSATVNIYLTPHGNEDYFTLSYWMAAQFRPAPLPPHAAEIA